MRLVQATCIVSPYALQVRHQNPSLDITSLIILLLDFKVARPGIKVFPVSHFIAAELLVVMLPVEQKVIAID